MDRAIRVSVSRLQKELRVDPFVTFGIPRNVRWDQVVPMTRHKSEYDRDTENRVSEYDIPRIKHFYNRFKAGKPVGALYVDACGKRVFLSNGYHRFAGAILAKAPSILIQPEPHAPPLSQETLKLLRYKR